MQMISSSPAGFNSRSLGTLGLVIFAFFGWLGVAASSLGALLFTLGILLHAAAYWRSMRRQPLFWLSLLAIGFILLHWLLQPPLDEQTANYAVRYSKGLVYLWLFSFIAWHLRGREEFARWLVGLAGVGLCIQVLLVTDWQNLAEFFKQRQDFGFSYTGAGLNCALSVWGLAFLGIFAYQTYGGWLKWGVPILALLAIGLLGETLILTESRAGWAALLAAILFAGLLFMGRERATLKSVSKRHLIVAAVVISLLLAGLLAANFKKLSSRILAEGDVYKTLLSFDRSKIPYSSVGARAHMLLYGIECWRERPWFGWGVGTSRSLLAKDAVLQPYDHPHFHNNYLELLVEQGVFGLLFYLIAFLILMRGLFQAYSEGAVAKDLLYYLIGAWVMVLVWSLADSRMVHVDVRFILLLLSGMTFSVMLAREENPVRN